VPGAQPGDEFPGIIGEASRASRSKKMNRVAGNGGDFREDLPQGIVNAAQEFGQVRADVILRCFQLKGENARGGELAGRLLEKLQCEEAVELRRLRLRQVDDENVKFKIRRSQEEAAVSIVDMNAGVRAQWRPGCGEVFLRQVQHGRIQLDVINPLQTRVL